MVQFILAFLATLLRILAFIALFVIDWALIMRMFRWFQRHGGVGRRRFVLLVALCGPLGADLLLPAYPPVAPAFLAVAAIGMAILSGLMGVYATNPSRIRRRQQLQNTNEHPTAH
ncbi:MAG: hypothetical protein ACLQUY_08435 [Ktedonobacterales bacterium]